VDGSDSALPVMTAGSVNASNVLAFEASGFLASGDQNNPYTETVARGLNTLFDQSSDSTLRNGDWLDAIQPPRTRRIVPLLVQPT